MKIKQFLVILSLVVIFIVTAFCSGLYLGYSNRPAILQVVGISHKEDPTIVPTADFMPFWKAWTILNERFVDTRATSSPEGPASDQDKIYGAIAGLTDSLGDPYTVFMPPEKKTQFEQEVSGNFGGVGMEVGMKDNTLTVISALPDSPAKKAGIMAGDKIIKIEATSTLNLNIDQAIRLIRGPKGTKVHLIMTRSKVDQPIEFIITRDTIIIPTVDTKKEKNGVFVLSLYNFSAQSPNLFRPALQEFINSGSDKLILDLRGNPGGYLEAAVDIASWFLPAGKIIVREDRGNGKIENTYISKGYDIFARLNRPVKMIILVDQGSASAAEIVAGALSENGVAILVGQKTFGKGSVQELIPVTSDTSLKVTIAHWLTPNGLSISHNGLNPKYSVPMTIDDLKAGRDPQLDKAIELLLAK
ncbi:MAG: peptidase S41 [Candidatus Vogelbacteria bacterium CG22_combo_CG10-13_8_21_14_all_37_9]|uniref:Peptidase S41 n=1 Tax=Candidatus Vogelbacteria bacterium CG22_combo_CG10-13_8_21_14_all_37_9 TaxID=1975046 RepID=A0A2H0BKV0_9BACT|nr:MAG: hypothetical protein BK005_01680 [bacterium CG10_37_50]PIP58305.1 MAG: peptidase S41 [Candidatus Vogelbacteria bacterium CG22_combo_CG10-13_8_21_14_all_37_9]